MLEIFAAFDKMGIMKDAFAAQRQSVEDQAKKEIQKREQKCAQNKETITKVETEIKDVIDKAIRKIKTKEQAGQP
jgi:hypothetical protein